MAMFNDLFELLSDVPPMLATAWAVWLGVGALLMVWFRRVTYEVEFPAPAPKPVSARPKPVARPSSSPDMLASDTTDTAAERTKPPVVVGDPFGDLATLLDQPAAAAPAEPRAPAESPILSSSGSPIRRANTSNDPNIA